MTAARDPLARVKRRPLPADWGPDEPMTLAEAVAVHWPDGLLTVSSLRTEIAKGALPFAYVNGRQWVTSRDLAALFAKKATKCPAARKAPASTSGPTGSTPGQDRKSVV